MQVNIESNIWFSKSAVMAFYWNIGIKWVESTHWIASLTVHQMDSVYKTHRILSLTTHSHYITKRLVLRSLYKFLHRPRPRVFHCQRVRVLCVHSCGTCFKKTQSYSKPCIRPLTFCAWSQHSLWKQCSAVHILFVLLELELELMFHTHGACGGLKMENDRSRVSPGYDI